MSERGGRPTIRVINTAAVRVLARSGAMLSVLLMSFLVITKLTRGDDTHDPNIGAGVLAMAAVGLVAMVGASRDGLRNGFGPAAREWTAAIGVLVVIGVWTLAWIGRSAHDSFGGALLDNLVPTVSVSMMPVAAVLVAAGAGNALRQRRATPTA